MNPANSARKIELFNSPLETGVRTLIVLNAAHPMELDLSQLTWLDHLVVHSGDIGGPESLHPDLPHRTGELLVRRSSIEVGLTLMRRLRLVDIVSGHNGILYRACEEAYPLVQLMKSTYAEELKARANWLAEHVCPLGASDFKKLVAERIGRWDVEFQHDADLVRRSS